MAASEKAKAEAKRWRDRLDVAQRLAKAEKAKIWDPLEDALAGYFPTGLAGGAEKKGAERVRIDGQVDINLLRWAATYYTSMCFDEFPTFRYARGITEDHEVVRESERIAALIYDEGGGKEESVEGMLSAMTRGPAILWVDPVEEAVPVDVLRAQSKPPGEYVDEVLSGARQPDDLPDGAPYEGIAADADARLSTPEVVLGFSPEQEVAVQAVSTEAKIRHIRSLRGPHSTKPRAKIQLSHTPYGTWCWWDTSVTKLSRAGWLARKFVHAPETFLASKAFNAAAKKYVRDRFETQNTGDAQGTGSSVGSTSATADTDKDVDSRDRVVVTEIHDKVNWKRYYLIDGFDEWAHEDDTYPHLRKSDGRPMFRDFFPCSIRVPIRVPREQPESMAGQPLLEGGWPIQLEFIKLHSAYIAAAERSGRTAVVGASFPDASLNKIANGKDMSIVKMEAGAGPLEGSGKRVEMIEWGEAPKDYLLAAQLLKREFASQVHISVLSMTSSDFAPTAEQDRMAEGGTGMTQGAVVRTFESWTAEAVEKGLAMFREHASPEEIVAWLGPGSDVRPPELDPNGMPVMALDPKTGQMKPKEKPSLAERFRATSLDRYRLECRFAVNTQAEDLATIKTHQDFAALNNVTLSPLGRPYFDPKAILSEIATLMDIHGLKDNELTDDMRAEMATMGAEEATTETGNRETPGGGRSDGRKGGPGEQRGPAGIPKSQARGRDPASTSNLQGQAERT